MENLVAIYRNKQYFGEISRSFAILRREMECTFVSFSQAKILFDSRSHDQNNDRVRAIWVRWQTTRKFLCTEIFRSTKRNFALYTMKLPTLSSISKYILIFLYDDTLQIFLSEISLEKQDHLNSSDYSYRANSSLWNYQNEYFYTKLMICTLLFKDKLNLIETLLPKN